MKLTNDLDVKMQRMANQSTLVRRMAIFVVGSLILIVPSLVLAGSDTGAVLCFGIALVAALSLFAFGVTRKGRQRVIALIVVTVYLLASIRLLSNYSLVRDHARWFFLSGSYKAKVLAQPANEQLQHAEWDGWGFAGVGDTTAYLVFDPTDALAGASEALPPVKASGLPCNVVRVRRLDRQWYAVLFYTDTYWGLGGCK